MKFTTEAQSHRENRKKKGLISLRLCDSVVNVFGRMA
jgi:hypothetical protein